MVCICVCVTLYMYIYRETQGTRIQRQNERYEREGSVEWVHS